MANWNSLLEDPLFNAGLGLLSGARTSNPWGAAAEQLNKFQALQQNRQYQQMHAKLYEAQAQRAQEDAAERARQNQARAAFASQFNPNAAPLDNMNAGIQAGALDPQQALFLQFQQAEQTTRAKAAEAARAEALAQTLDQRREAAALRDEASRRHDQVLMAMKSMGLSAARGNSDVLDELRRTQIEKNRQDIEKADRLAAEGKPLPTPAMNQLSTAGTAFETTDRLARTFRPEYAGKTIAGDLSNTTKRIFGDETGQAQWWQDFQRQEMKVRNEVFGSALTATELPEWEKATITPRMDPAQIQQNLARRRTLEERAVTKLRNAYEAGGYNKQQIRELTQLPDAVAGAPAAARTEVRRVKLKNGKTGVEYSDGTRAVLD